MRLLFFISILSLANTACTLYQSTGREAIEKNAGGIVNTTGFDANFKNFYSCTATANVPSFLKEELVVLESPTEAEGYTVLAATQDKPQWVYVYTYHEGSKIHFSCQVHRLVSQENDTKNIILVGVHEILALETRQSSN